MAIHKTVGQNNRDARNTTIGEPAGGEAPYVPPSVPWIWNDGRQSTVLTPWPASTESRWVVPLDSATIGCEDAVGTLASAVLIDEDGVDPVIPVNGWIFQKYEESYYIYPNQALGEP